VITISAYPKEDFCFEGNEYYCIWRAITT